MKDNYFLNTNIQQNINLYNPEKKSILSNNTFTNSLSFEGNKTIANSDESLGIEEFPPMEEDIDHLKNFNLQNRNNIYHFSNLGKSNIINKGKQGNRSFSVNANNINNDLANQTNNIRKTEDFYLNRPNNIKIQNNPFKKDNGGIKPQGKALKSRYSSASENKYHFIHKLALNPQFIIMNPTNNNIKKVNYSPIDSNKLYHNTIPNNNPNIIYYNNNNNLEHLYSNKIQSPISSPINPNQNTINSNNNQNTPFNERENRFKQVSNYGYKTLDVKKLPNNIGNVKINEFKSANQMQNKIFTNNNIISGFDINGNVLNHNQNNNLQIDKNQNYYSKERLTNTPTTNNQLFKEINLGYPIQRNTYLPSNNNYLDPFFNIQNNNQIVTGKNTLNFNQAIKNAEVKKKQPEIAVVTKITENNYINQDNNSTYQNYFAGMNNNPNPNNQILNNKIPLQNKTNNNININFIQNNINNINIKNQNDLMIKQPLDNYIPQDINELINQNLAQYMANPQQKIYTQNKQIVPSTINQQKKVPQDKIPKKTSDYRTATNTVITNHMNFNPQGLNNLNIFPVQKQPSDNYIAYNKPESERLTITNDKIQTPIKPLVQKDVDVTYNDFDGSGFVKNYGGVSHPGKDSSGKQKTNQDALVCKTNINNIKDFNIFGVLDGHGPEGHLVSQFAAEFIPSKIVNHPEIKVLKEPEKIYQKLKDNNCYIITQAFIDADSKLKTVDFDALESGSTCCLIIHIGKHIICANSGDSRALVVFDNPGNKNINNLNYWKAVPLSLDYKPEIPEEMNRIIMSGGVVEQMKDEFGEGCGPYRVWVRGKDYPGLAMSRSIGDLKGKEVGVIPNPGILEYDLNKSTRYVIACSDGVFEFLDNQKVMELGKHFFLKNDASAYCHELVSNSLIEWEINDNIVDDITAVVAFF